MDDLSALDRVELERRLAAAEARNGPFAWEKLKAALTGKTAFGVKTLLVLAGVALAAAWLVSVALTEHVDVVGLLITLFIPFAVLLGAVVGLALALTYAVVWVRNSDLFDRHNATSEARCIRERACTPDEKPGDNEAIARMYEANTRFILVLVVAAMWAFVGFIAVAAFGKMVL